MTTFTTGGSAVTFTTSGSAVSFAVAPASNAFTTSAVLTPGAHASTHGAGGADPITTLGAVAHSGQQTFAAGSAAGPSIAATGDTNTGVYFPAADEVAISTAGTARVFVTAAGLVGIGTAVPGVALDVYSAAASTIRMMSDSGATLQARTASDTASTVPNVTLSKSKGTNAARTIVAADDFVGTVNFAGWDGSAYRNAAQISAEVDGTPGASDMPGRIRFSTTADGASSPTERLRISNNGQLTTGLGSAGTPVLSFTGDTNTGIYSPGADQVGIATAGTAAVIVDASQRVIVGNTSSVDGYKVQTATTDGANFGAQRFSNDASGPFFRFTKSRGSMGANATVNSGDSGGVISWRAADGTGYVNLASIEAVVDATPGTSDMPGRLTFWTTADGTTTLNERMRIDNAGLITGTGTSLGAWTNYTPTVTSGTGTLTTVTANGYYCQIGKIVHLRARITLTTNGTGATDLRMTMPVAARNVDVRPVGSGRESAITGKQLVVWALQNGSTAYIVFYDNTYPGGDGRSYDLSMTYEIN